MHSTGGECSSSKIKIPLNILFLKFSDTLNIWYPPMGVCTISGKVVVAYQQNESVTIPGQGSLLQFSYSFQSPEHCFPPCLAIGWLQKRYLECCPLPHALLHAAQVDHLLHPPSIGANAKQRNYQRIYTRRTCINFVTYRVKLQRKKLLYIHNSCIYK